MSLRSVRDQIEAEYDGHERFLASLSPAQRYGYDLDPADVIATCRCPRRDCAAELGESCQGYSAWLNERRAERGEVMAHVERRLRAGEMLHAHPPGPDAFTRSCLIVDLVLGEFA